MLPKVPSKKKKKKAKQKSLAAIGHFLASRGCFFGSSSSSGDILSISCAIWDAALASAPLECGQRTMPSFQDLQRWERSLPVTAQYPSLCYFLPYGQHLERRAWRLLGIAMIWSPPPCFLNRSHSFQCWRETNGKGHPRAIRHLRKLVHGSEPECFRVCVMWTCAALRLDNGPRLWWLLLGTHNLSGTVVDAVICPKASVFRTVALRQSVMCWLLTAESLFRREGVTGSYALGVKGGSWLPQGCTCLVGAASQLLGEGCEGLGPLPTLQTSRLQGFLGTRKAPVAAASHPFSPFPRLLRCVVVLRLLPEVFQHTNLYLRVWFQGAWLKSGALLALLTER